MTPYQKRRNNFVQRMADDLKLRNYSANTIDTYTWHVTKFCEYFGKPPERLGPKHIREYQLFLVNDKKASWSSFNLPGKTPDVPLSSATIQKSMKLAVA